MKSKKTTYKIPEFYVCAQCSKYTESGVMQLVSRKINLFPCGLPRIDYNPLYTIEEIDKVALMCGELGKKGVCTEKIAGECSDLITKEWLTATKRKDAEYGKNKELPCKRLRP